VGEPPRAGILSGRGFDGDRIDVAIAATAELRGFAILTNNARHFEPLGVRFLNPFVALPP
jgi:predicted nucleic acid-binding protein